MGEYSSWDVVLRDREGRPFGVGSMVEYIDESVKYPKPVTSTVCEVVLKDDGRILVKVNGHKTRPVTVDKINVVRLTERESILHAEFARRGIAVTPEELAKMVSMLNLTYSGDVIDDDRNSGDAAEDKLTKDALEDKDDSMVDGAWSDEDVMIG